MTTSLLADDEASACRCRGDGPLHGALQQASREYSQESSVIRVGPVRIGGSDVVVMAGPCSVESHEGLFAVARRVKAAGASILRGGAFKPRTSPYSFQGLGREGLELLQQAGRETGLAVGPR